MLQFISIFAGLVLTIAVGLYWLFVAKIRQIKIAVVEISKALDSMRTILSTMDDRVTQLECRAEDAHLLEAAHRFYDDNPRKTIHCPQQLY